MADVQKTIVVATATDVANRETDRNATNVTGGKAGFVNSALRNTDNVGPGDKSYEWAEVNILTSAATAGEDVAGYDQANGSSTGPVWAAVDEVRQTGPGNAIGPEVDTSKPAGSPGQAIGLDIVDKGNMDAAFQSPDGEVIWRDRDPRYYSTCIISLPGGGLRIMVRGEIVFDHP